MVFADCVVTSYEYNIKTTPYLLLPHPKKLQV